MIRNTGKKVKYIKTKVFLLFILLFLCLNLAWVRTVYFCDLTGRKRIVDRVFFVPVHTIELDTDTSRWLDTQLGATQSRLWLSYHHRTFIDLPYTIANMTLARSVYQECVLVPDTSENRKKELLEAMQKLRKREESERSKKSGGYRLSDQDLGLFDG